MTESRQISPETMLQLQVRHLKEQLDHANQTAFERLVSIQLHGEELSRYKQKEQEAENKGQQEKADSAMEMQRMAEQMRMARQSSEGPMVTGEDARATIEWRDPPENQN